MIRYFIFLLITFIKTTYINFRVEVNFEIVKINGSRILKCKKTEIFKDETINLNHGCLIQELNLDNYYFWQDSIQINYFLNRNVI